MSDAPLIAQQAAALTSGESDQIAALANASALLKTTDSGLSWAGFYLLKNNELVVGPFQGGVACAHIAIGKGVVGECAASLSSRAVSDVSKVKNYIACDSNAKSEFVVPMVDSQGQLFAVLDLDAPTVGYFDQKKKQDELTAFAKAVMDNLPMD